SRPRTPVSAAADPDLVGDRDRSTLDAPPAAIALVEAVIVEDGGLTILPAEEHLLAVDDAEEVDEAKVDVLQRPAHLLDLAHAGVELDHALLERLALLLHRAGQDAHAVALGILGDVERLRRIEAHALELPRRAVRVSGFQIDAAA